MPAVYLVQQTSHTKHVGYLKSQYIHPEYTGPTPQGSGRPSHSSLTAPAPAAPCVCFCMRAWGPRSIAAAPSPPARAVPQHPLQRRNQLLLPHARPSSDLVPPAGSKRTSPAGGRHLGARRRPACWITLMLQLRRPLPASVSARRPASPAAHSLRQRPQLGERLAAQLKA